MLGKTVTVTVDRPLGSVHPKHNNIIYPVNYGYVKGIIAHDGEEQDAYILGVNEPLEKFTGKVIGVIHRLYDVEDKWVVAGEDSVFTQNEIAEKVHFQEQYFKGEIDALYQKSCGAVIYRKSRNGLEFLCIFQKSSQTYSVPKGHMEAFEIEVQTAKREIMEEVGLSVDFAPDFREIVQYDIPDGKHKTVVLFLCECCGELNTDKSEIESYEWLSAEKAKEILPPWYAPVLDKVQRKIYEH